MGDPKQTRKKFETPPHPWQKSRIEEEKQIIREYGLGNKKEVWKMRTKARGFADQAKRLTAQETAQSQSEEKQLLARLNRLGLLPQGSTVDDVLGITIKDILERRLQTIVFKKGLAKSIKQARQFIIHRHVAIGGKIITAPSYLVPVAGESVVSFIGKSPLSDPEHPERVIEKEAPKAPKKKRAKKGAHGKPEKAKAKKVKKKESKPEGKKEEKKAEPKKEEKAEEKKE